MLLDFSDIKRVVSQWIDDQLDHRMLLHRDDPFVPIMRDAGEPLYLLDEKSHGRKHREVDLRVHLGARLPNCRGASVGNTALLRHVSPLKGLFPRRRVIHSTPTVATLRRFSAARF